LGKKAYVGATPCGCPFIKALLMIRKANISDVKEIHGILSFFSKKGILLGRSLSDIYDQIRDFVVFFDPDDNSVVGTCSLHICWEDIAEIRSLAVKEGYQGKGIGKKLVTVCLEEAVQIGIGRLFVLTYVEGFFNKIGFHSVDKSILPHKVWSDCLNCVKFPDCDEKAMMIEIS
jgi:amino-acid N-acetyltransferase